MWSGEYYFEKLGELWAEKGKGGGGVGGDKIDKGGGKIDKIR